jgi:hypothetical protein
MTTTKSLTNVSLYDSPYADKGNPSAFTKTNSSFSLPSNRLTVEYVTKSELKLPSKKLLMRDLSSSKHLSSSDNITENKFSIIKSHTDFGHYTADAVKHSDPAKHPTMVLMSKTSISNRKDLRTSLRESQKKLLNRFISRDDCKDYLDQLRMRDHLEKQSVFKVSEEISNQNKSKFDYYMKSMVESSSNLIDDQSKKASRAAFNRLRMFGTIKTFNEFKDFKDDQMDYVAVEQQQGGSNKQKFLNRHLLPSLLNQIRLTNFSNEYNTRQKSQLERQSKRYYKDIKTVISCYDDHRHTPAAYSPSQDFIQLNTSFYVVRDDNVKTDEMKDDEEYDCADDEMQTALNSKDLEKSSRNFLHETSNFTKPPVETPVDLNPVETSTVNLNVFVTNMTDNLDGLSCTPHGAESRFSSTTRSEKDRNLTRSGMSQVNHHLDDDLHLAEDIDDLNCLSKSFK